MTRVFADTERCEGHGMCEAVAPELFRVGDDDVVIVTPGELAEADLENARLAADSCPMAALRIE